MTQINYLRAGATLNTYDAAALSYIDKEQTFINKTANDLNLPNINTAIAGAMAEEHSGFDVAKGLATDYIAKYDIPFIDLADAFASGLLAGQGNINWNSVLSSLQENEANYQFRSNQEWIDSYNDFVAQNIDITDFNAAETYALKYQYPVLVDLGPANFNMATAIRLIQETPTSLLATLGLDGYQNNYSLLAQHLSADNQGITAKFYGLLIKEADAWFTSKNAYGSDWATLPQEIKDALYVTYTNLGHNKMEERYNEATANGTLPFYEPLPAASTAGGVNHLFNTSAIANAIGVTGYGDISFINDASTWLENAKLDNAEGAAYREALVKLRPFAMFDHIYEGGVEFRDNFTDEYLQDRTDMLAWKMELRYSGANPDSNILFGDSSNLTYYEDLTTQQAIVLGSTVGAKQIIFGGGADDSINGDTKGDRLYGGAGNDTLIGKAVRRNNHRALRRI